MLGRRLTVVFRSPAPSRLTTTTPFQCRYDLTSRLLPLQAVRGYAKPGRPKKAVGEPSRPVKRAVKRAAKSADSSDTAAAEKIEAKKKAAAEKPKPKKPAKKQLTEEEKAAKTAKLLKAEVSELKKAALEPPRVSTLSAYIMFVKEKAKDIKGPLTGSENIRERLSSFSKATAAEYKQLTPADIEHYNHLAHTELESHQASYKSWVEEHTPEQIQLANVARRTLRRKLPAKKGCKSPWQPINDERAAKPPVSAWIQFNVTRQASGDFKHISLPERTKLLAQEWKALSEDEKKKYKTLEQQDAKRYVEEYSSTYGHAPKSVEGVHLEYEQSQAAAAAA